MNKEKKMTKKDVLTFLGEEKVSENKMNEKLAFFKEKEQRFIDGLKNFSINRYLWKPLSTFDNEFFFDFGENITDFFVFDVNELHMGFLHFVYEDFEQIFADLQEKYNQDYKYFIDLIVDDRLFRQKIDWNEELTDFYKEKYGLEDQVETDGEESCDEDLDKKDPLERFKGLNLTDVCDGLVLHVGSIGDSPTFNSVFQMVYYGMALSLVRMNIKKLNDGETTIIKLDEFL